jgi:hypothetical protein
LPILAVLGCGDAEPPVLPGTRTPPCELASTIYIVDEIALPLTVEGYNAVAFDLDGRAGVDNRLGRAFDFFSDAVVLSGPDRITDGRILWLLELEECANGSSPYARARLHAGTDLDGDPADNFSGSETFGMQVAAELPSVGARDGSRITASEGYSATPAVSLFDIDEAPSEWFGAHGVVLEVDLAEGSVAGRIGFALDAEEVKDALATRYARLYSEALALDPTCGVEDGICGSLAAMLAVAFDLDDDRRVTRDELLANYPNDVGQQYLLPDVDLFADDQYWPAHDGREDHVAMAISFHAVGAAIAAP